MNRFRSDGLRLRAQAEPWHQGVAFVMWDLRQQKAYRLDIVVGPDELKDAEIPKPSFRLDTDDAQTLMDDLWQAGLRPTEGTGSAGAYAALERHLEDLQALILTPTGTTLQTVRAARGQRR